MKYDYPVVLVLKHKPSFSYFNRNACEEVMIDSSSSDFSWGLLLLKIQNLQSAHTHTHRKLLETTDPYFTVAPLSQHSGMGRESFLHSIAISGPPSRIFKQIIPPNLFLTCFLIEAYLRFKWQTFYRTMWHKYNSKCHYSEIRLYSPEHNLYFSPIMY